MRSQPPCRRAPCGQHWADRSAAHASLRRPGSRTRALTCGGSSLYSKGVPGAGTGHRGQSTCLRERQKECYHPWPPAVAGLSCLKIQNTQGPWEIEAKKGLPSADRNDKATLLLTGPFRTAKSSAKDLIPHVSKLQYANSRRPFYRSQGASAF
jgi:hypothetical protein